MRGCEIDRAKVSLAMTMTLPMLATTVGVPPDVLKRWNTFVGNTITHETGHVNLNLQGARDYQRDLGNFPPAPDCEMIQLKVKNLFDSGFAAIDRMNADYDAKTQHGFKQGAVFP